MRVVCFLFIECVLSPCCMLRAACLLKSTSDPPAASAVFCGSRLNLSSAHAHAFVNIKPWGGVGRGFWLMRDFEVSHPIISLLFSLLKSTYPSARVPRPVHRPPFPRAVPDSGQQVRAFVGWQWGVGTSVVGCEQQAKVELIFRDQSICVQQKVPACSAVVRRCIALQTLPVLLKSWLRLRGRCAPFFFLPLQ